MPVRLVITTYAKPGKGAELAQAMADRCRAVQQELGCQQYEVFQSALDPRPKPAPCMTKYPHTCLLDLISSQKSRVQGAKPPAGGAGVAPEAPSFLCSPPQEASYDWMSVRTS